MDMNWYGIWALKKLGLAQNVKTADLPSLLAKQAEEAAREKPVRAVHRPCRVARTIGRILLRRSLDLAGPELPVGGSRPYAAHPALSNSPEISRGQPRPPLYNLQKSSCRFRSRRKRVIFFLVLGICLVALAVVLNISWIVLNCREGVLFFLGVIFFIAIIIGLILNTVFLVREIRRSEQHDSFINAMTHELKTPITSIRLHLETLQRREVDETRRQTFYRLMLDDSDRLLRTVEQVLKAGQAGYKRHGHQKGEIDFKSLVGECVEVARARHHVEQTGLHFNAPSNGTPLTVLGDAEELRTAVLNILDNAIKYSGSSIECGRSGWKPHLKRKCVSKCAIAGSEFLRMN